MRISRKKRPEKPQIRFKYNEGIRTPRLKIVDDEGNFLGEMDTRDALRMAEEQGKDLIEIVPKGDLHIAKITDYGRFRYQKEKEIKRQKAQQKKIEVKGIRLSSRIGRHDIDLRIRQALKFLEDGDKVKVELMLKGREKGHPDIGREVLNNFVKETGDKTPIKIEQPVSRQGWKFFVIIAPGQNNFQNNQEKAEEQKEDVQGL
ncbi:MAG: translation initiation factor IF-3 [Parcubacteria group bacterium CG10_big_fil_rev_8_21_14_0_10_36_14]|nr:MAG: translation initiation factor IF-3 [Parcubacteria group bacterium CG10_big_fil_rev_8_21_14_0_10_36_14]